MIQRIKDSVDASDMVLVGIGYEWRWDEQDNEAREKLIKGYQMLKEMLGDKRYYIITLAVDDLIYEVFGEDSNIVAPCGTKRLMQCDKHLVKTKEAVIKDGIRCCPECGRELAYNTIDTPGYIEEGYIPKFMEYKKWLQGTVNRKLCILELGVGLQYPSVIRLAFDKMCMYNQKCTFYRIHHNLYQHTEENAERGVGISANSLEFMTDFE